MIPVKKIFMVLCLLILFLVIMHLVAAKIDPTLFSRFNLNAEANIPTWFSTELLFSISIISFLIYRDEKNRINSRIWKYFWLFFSCVFCFLSIDEAARLHEIFDLHIIKWLVIYSPFAGLFLLGCVFYFQVISKDKLIRKLMYIGLLIAGLGGFVGEAIPFIINLLKGVLIEIYVFEESFEMLGEVIILSACLVKRNNQIKYSNKPI